MTRTSVTATFLSKTVRTHRGLAHFSCSVYTGSNVVTQTDNSKGYVPLVTLSSYSSFPVQQWPNCQLRENRSLKILMSRCPLHSSRYLNSIFISVSPINISVFNHNQYLTCFYKSLRIQCRGSHLRRVRNITKGDIQRRHVCPPLRMENLDHHQADTHEI